VLYVILRLFPVVGQVPGLDARPWFIGFGLLSVVVATLLLIYFRDFKRMFAFSTIEHMGIILIAAGLGGADAHLGAAYQLTAHAIAKSCCFFAAGTVLLATGTQDIGSIRGLARTSPLTALVLVSGGFAIAGAPPFAVFFSEFIILKAGLARGEYLVMGLLALCVVIAFCGVMFHVTRMAFGPPATDTRSLPIPGLCRTALVVAAVPLVCIGLYVPERLHDLLLVAAEAMGQ
jgi:hydrogenase-4 component F